MATGGKVEKIVLVKNGIGMLKLVGISLMMLVYYQV